MTVVSKEKYPGGFRKLGLADKEFFNSLDTDSSLSCERSFDILFCWADVLDTHWLQLDGEVVIYYGAEDLFLLPAPPDSPETIKQISDHLASLGLSGNFYDIDLDFTQKHENYLKKYFKVHYSEDTDDYIFNTEDLIALKGGKLRKKRNLIRQFEREHGNYDILMMDQNLTGRCLEFCRNFYVDAEASESQRNDFKAVCRALENFTALDLHGLVLAVNHRIAAFSISSKINEQCADILFERISRDYKGAGPMLNCETARQLRKLDFTRVNMEQDLGVMTLRQAKRSYAPQLMYRRCILNRQ